MRPREPQTTFLDVEEVKEEVVVNLTGAWVNRVSFPIDELDHVDIVTVSQASLVTASLSSVSSCCQHKVAEALKCEHLCIWISLLVSQSRPVLQNHDFLILDLGLKAVNPNWVEKPVPRLLCD